MKHLKKIKLLFATLTFLAFAFMLAGCAKLEPVKDIPSDSQAGNNPSVSPTTIMFPNFHHFVEKGDITVNMIKIEGHTVLNIVMNGIYDLSAQEWLYLSGTGKSDQNVWLSIDSKPKGIDVSNDEKLNGNNNLNSIYDVVFLVDNSGSMTEEADTIAGNIIAWTALLEKSGLNVRFGCVGYGYNSDNKIYGAINITDANSLKDYLGRSNDGRLRTVGYGGQDANHLESLAQPYSYPGGECGVLALRFADKHFSFRNSASRAYINFTDEPNQPGGSEEWSVEYVKKPANWNTTKGTIHTVYSETTTNTTWSNLSAEKPWLLSQYTVGTEVFPPANFSGVTLTSLPITNVLTNTEGVYTIRCVIDEFMDGQNHTVKITIKSKNGQVRAERTVSLKFSYK